MPNFETKKEKFAWLKEHEQDILAFKKASFKTADALSIPANTITELPKFTSKGVIKAVVEDGVIRKRVVINTTMLRDSHKDVHIDGIWNKSLKENRRLKHLQEHKMEFDKIIADKDDLKASVKTYDWKELGYDVEGKTEALVFDSTIRKDRNERMYNEYKSGNVDNHSVGMFYVNLKMAMDSKDKDDVVYKAEWDKHIDKIANKAEVKKDGFFFPVYEAKVIEGSAVPMGSNHITPTLETKSFEEEEAEIDQLDNSQIKINAIKKFLEI